MAGVKGRSGGARPGAGRPRKIKPAQEPGTAAHPGHPAPAPPAAPPVPNSPLFDGTKRDALEFLELVVNDPRAPLKDRIRAAIAAAQYRHTKRGDGGKKEETDERAKKAATGRFGPRRPPPLTVVGGGA